MMTNSFQNQCYLKGDQIERKIHACCDENKIDCSTTVPTYKVILIGDSNVGKTCLAFRTCVGKFPQQSVATIGVDFVELKIKVENEIVKLQLWDSAGTERFRSSLVRQYYRNVHGVVFVYDITDRLSFENLNKWINELHLFIDSPSDIPQMIIGNKCDLHADRSVRTSEAKALSNSYGLPLWETSAKSDLELYTIKTIFQSLAETLKLKTPLVAFPPHHSQIIQAGHQKGLRVNQSLSSSSSSKSNSSILLNKKANKSTEDMCCGTG